MNTSQQNLLTAAKEARDVLAIAMQLIVRSPPMMDSFERRCQGVGIKPGFGARLQAAIEEAEEELC